MQYDPFLGRSLDGKYRIIDYIGEGGMGTVYLAEHEALPRRFAIKILKTDYLDNENFVERFRREAIAASRVVHPNIVYITDFGRLTEGNFYIVMEYLEGEGLDDVLDTQGKLPLSRAIPILIQIADALNYAHKMGVVHRDLKAENVLLVSERGKKDAVKLLDFGIARLMLPDFSNTRITRDGQVFGTPEYMSPEQASDKPIDGRSDIYSLGILAFELVTGQPPFFDEDPTEILQSHLSAQPPVPSTLVPNQPIPKIFDGMVLKCLAKSPNDRYQTAGEIKSELLRVRNTLTSMAKGFAGIKTPHKSYDEVSSIAIELQESASQIADMHSKTAADLRTEYHETLKELLIRLVNKQILSDDYLQILDKIIDLETESFSINASITLREQDFEKIRFEMGQKEQNIRYAIMDLKQEYKNFSTIYPVPGKDELNYLKDLEYQIQELSSRFTDIVKNKREKFTALNKELDLLRQSLEQKELAVSNYYAQIMMEVEKLRTTDQRVYNVEFGLLFEKLDKIKKTIDEVRKKVGITSS